MVGMELAVALVAAVATVATVGAPVGTGRRAEAGC